MRVTRISGLDFAELTVGHSRLLAEDVGLVVGHFTGAATLEASDFEAHAFRVMAAGASIAGEEATGQKPARTIAALDTIASELVWSVSPGDCIAALTFILDLRPAAPGSESSEKKPTG